MIYVRVVKATTTLSTHTHTHTLYYYARISLFLFIANAVVRPLHGNNNGPSISLISLSLCPGPIGAIYPNRVITYKSVSTRLKISFSSYSPRPYAHTYIRFSPFHSRWRFSKRSIFFPPPIHTVLFIGVFAIILVIFSERFDAQAYRDDESLWRRVNRYDVKIWTIRGTASTGDWFISRKPFSHSNNSR